MNGPTIIGILIIAAILAAIVGRWVYNKKHHRSGCGCGCNGCAGNAFCHSNADTDKSR